MTSTTASRAACTIEPTTDPQPFIIPTDVERLQGRGAGLLELAHRGIGVRAHHRDEHVAAHGRARIDELGVEPCDGVCRAAEVAQAVAELGAELGVVKVPDPFGVVVRTAALEVPAPPE